MASVIHKEKFRILAEKCRSRWFPFRHVEEREEMMRMFYSREKRFIICHSGRRSYKTESWKRAVVTEAVSNRHGMPYGCGNPTSAQARRIWWEDLKLLSYSPFHKKEPNESRMEIYPDEGSPICVLGLDKPERIEGAMWGGLVLDEFDNLKAKTWKMHVRPALDSVYQNGYMPWAALLGVPEIGGELEVLVKETIGLKDWQTFCWPSSRVLNPAQIEAAMHDMSPEQFSQEYEGKFVQPFGVIYGNYNELNFTDEVINENEELIWTHDQNYTPLSSAIIVKRGEKYYCLDEIVLRSADAADAALEFTERYKNHSRKTVKIYGDPHGKVGEKHGKKSDYRVIENALRAAGWTVINKVKSAHPAIKDRQNSLRALVCNAAGERRFFVNTKKARYVNKGLATVKAKEGSAFIEDDANEYHHITTAIGYFADVEHPVKRILQDTGMPLKPFGY